MKKLLICLVAIVSIISAYSQDIIDPPKLPTDFNDSTIYDKNFTNTNFIRGWSFGTPGRKLDEAMYMNYYLMGIFPQWDNTYQYTDSSFYIKNHRRTVVIDSVVGGRNGTCILNAHSIYLEPTIIVDSTNNFKPRQGDSTGAVFGWYYRNFDVGDTTNDFNRFLLYDSNLTNGPEIVLDSIWNGSIIRWLDYDGDDHGYSNVGRTNDSLQYLNTQRDKDNYHIFNGKQWYLTINLRALDSADVENHLTDTILIIKIPYKLSHYGSSIIDSGFVKFDSIPFQSFTQDSEIHSSINNQFRGVYRKLDSSTIRKPTEFIITGEMLKNLNLLSQNKSKTLSAFAIFDGDTLPDGSYVYNPLFKNEWWENRYDIKDYISSIDVEVTYCGNLDVGIDYIRFETPRTRKVFWGVYDSTIQAKLIQIDTILRDNNNSIRIHRFYADDELAPIQWVANRYYNMLVDTLVTVETYPFLGNEFQNPPSHYLHATGFKQYWSGSNVNFGTHNSNPFVRKTRKDGGVVHPYTFHYEFGYAGSNNLSFTDTLDSEYETYIDSTVPIPFPDDVYSPNKYARPGIQFNLEYWIYNNYYMNPKLIFNVKPWYAFLWVQSEIWYKDTTINSFCLAYRGNRPKTGEELRLMINEPIILGTKGLFYWFKTRNDSLPNSLFSGLQNSMDSNFQRSLPTGDTLVYSDIISGDYIDLSDSTFYNWKNHFISSVYDWQTMRVDSNHIYIGLKSARAEIMKKNMWIQEVEDTLLNLKLVAWYGKGFKILYLDSTEIQTDTIIKEFIQLDTTKLKTRKIGNSTYEAWDSSFFDITVLKDNNNSMNDIFYVGVLNRRTDPLIFKDSELQFITTAEFEDKCGISPDTSKYSSDSLTWRTYWWKRLGCRELFLPFDFLNSEDNNEYALLHVTELGGGNAELNAQKWRNEKYYHNIDTIIGQNRSAIIKLLPGEGKILKVEVMHPAKNIKGNLEFSNQSKMVVHPELDSNGNVIDSLVRYHLVYHRPICQEDTCCDTTGVFYRRSKPIYKDSPYENIVWNNEVFLSAHVYRDCTGGDILDSLPCDYPSIVVRKDGTNLKAYVVYSCYDLYSHSPLGNVAETVIDLDNLHDEDGGIITSLYGRFIGEFNGLDRKEWGTPVINASANGNYYAWSDSLGGIIAGFKSTSSNCIQYDTVIKWNSSSASAKHPSLNVYSSIDNQEDNCALVWQEKQGISVQNKFGIYYTRLKKDNNLLKYYLSKKFNFPYTDNVRLNNDTSIAYVSFGTQMIDNIFPVVGRNLNGYNFNQSNWLGKAGEWNFEPNRYDVVLWESAFTNRCIAGGTIALLDSANKPLSWQPCFVKRIYSLNTELHQPIISQGESILSNASFDSDLGSFALNFLYGYIQSPPSALISQLSIQEYTILPIYNDKLDMGSIGLKRIGNGYQPHLALYPGFNFGSRLWRNRQIFHNSGCFNASYLMTSAKYFYRATDNDIESEPMIGFNSDASKYVINLPKVDGNNLGIYLPYTEIIDTVYGNRFIQENKDTLYSDWFTVLSSIELEFKCFGADTSKYKMYIQKEGSSTFTNIPIPSETSDSTGILMNYTSINGGGYNYRLVFVNRDSSSGYTEEIIIDNLPVQDTIFGKRASSIENIIDLSSLAKLGFENSKIELKIFPNPVKNTVYISAYLPEISHLNQKVIIIIYSTLGNELYKQEIISGETIAVPINNYPGGAYFIKAEYKNENYWLSNPVIPSLEPFIIEK